MRILVVTSVDPLINPTTGDVVHLNGPYGNASGVVDQGGDMAPQWYGGSKSYVIKTDASPFTVSAAQRFSNTYSKWTDVISITRLD